MNTQVSRPGHMLPMWERGERQPYGGHEWHEVPNACSDSERPSYLIPYWDRPAVKAALAHPMAEAVLIEKRCGEWLDRVMWCAAGVCVGCLAMWLALIA